MDARARGHGILVPSPQSHSSQLGNVVYFDTTGVLITFASIFAERNLPIPGGLSGLRGLSSEWQVSRKNFPDTVSMTTTGVLAKPIERSEGLILSDTFPPRPMSTTPLFGYRLERAGTYRGSCNSFILGPKFSESSLAIPESLIRSWFDQNRCILASARTPKVNHQSPYAFVVLKEWVSETWVNVSWGPSDSGPTTIGLFQESEELAPQWNYLSIGKDTMTLSKIDGNLQERRPWVVAVDGIVFPLKPNLNISFRTIKHVWSESYKKLFSSNIRNNFGWNFVHDVKTLKETVQGLREGHISVEVQSSTDNFLVPYQRNENFTGRQKLLEALWMKLCEVAPKQWNHRVALYGLGGIGKTQIALEYVYAQQANYKYIFWISAVDAASFLSGFQAIAKWTHCLSDYRKPVQTAEGVLNWLNQREDWLLVIDNLDDMNVIAGRLPSCSPTRHTLITTRYSHCDHIPAQGLEVGVLDPNDAIDLLLLRSKGERDGSTEKETAECAKIVKELGYLPLAIEQAAACIREASKDLYIFLPSYWENRQFYHSRVSKGNLRYYGQSIATTWRPCLQILEETNTDAIQLVQLMSFLNPDGILVDFLDTGKDGLSADLRPIVSNKIRFYEAVAALERFSLIGRQGSGSDGERLTIHRLVQSVIKDEMPQGLLSTMAECVIQLCAVAFPPLHNWDHTLLLQSRRYVGQVLMPLVTIHQLQSNDFVNLLLRVGIFLREEGKYQESSKLVLKAVEVLNMTRGPNHLETINALAILALTYQSQGRWNEAVELQGRALKTSMRVLGEEHPETLRVMKNLAVSLHGQRRGKQAVDLLERVLEVSTRLLGVEHPDTLMAMANLAATYRSQGRWDEAGKLQESVLEASSRLFGDEHPDTFMAMINLASTYRSQGRLDDAMNLQQKGLEVSTRVVGMEHPETVTAMANLALTYWSQRRWDEAGGLQEKVLEVRTKLLGTDHPDTVMAMAILALTYGIQGKLGDALKLQKGLDVSTMLPGTALPDMNATDNDGRTLLHYAAGAGAGLELVKWLIDNMADVNATDKDGSTVLHYAAESGLMEVVEWLVAEQREIISIKNTHGETALDVSKRRRRDEIIEFLGSHIH